MKCTSLGTAIRSNCFEYVRTHKGSELGEQLSYQLSHVPPLKELVILITNL